MPFVLKKHYDEMNHALTSHSILEGEYARHDEFVKKYEGTFASMNRDSNFADLKSKRDLLALILQKTVSNKGDVQK